jgi:hypothetical protein
VPVRARAKRRARPHAIARRRRQTAGLPPLSARGSSPYISLSLSLSLPPSPPPQFTARAPPPYTPPPTTQTKIKQTDKLVDDPTFRKSPRDVGSILDDSASTLFVTEVFRGMAYTLKAFFDPKLTINYPFEKGAISEFVERCTGDVCWLFEGLRVVVAPLPSPPPPPPHNSLTLCTMGAID